MWKLVSRLQKMTCFERVNFRAVDRTVILERLKKGVGIRLILM